LVENRVKGRWSGRTRTNKLVFFDAPGELIGQVTPVAIERAGAWSLQGPQALSLAVI
jgi:tRNA-2-methylthio-N6-dimethylallyladenosine synthase